MGELSEFGSWEGDYNLECPKTIIGRGQKSQRLYDCTRSQGQGGQGPWKTKLKGNFKFQALLQGNQRRTARGDVTGNASWEIGSRVSDDLRFMNRMRDVNKECVVIAKTSMRDVEI